MQVVGYCRVSSREQAINTHALEQQQGRLLLAGVDLVLSDVDSGSKDNRVNWKKLHDMIQQGQVSKVFCTRLDRLTRSLPALRGFIDVCNACGVVLVALDDNVDGSTAAGKFHINMLGALAEMETDRLSERCKHGHEHHRRRKAPYFAPFGYVKVDDRLKLDQSPLLSLLETKQQLSRADVARDLVEIFLRTQTLRKCLREFNEKYGLRTFSGRGKGNRQMRGKLGFGVSGLTSWLNNPILRGHLAYGRTGAQRQSHSQGWQIVYDTHQGDRLISDSEYLQIEKILNHNVAVGGYGFNSETVHPLSGLVYCGECRGRCRIMHYRLRSDKTYKVYSYQCNNYHFKTCTQKHYVRVEVIETALIEKFTERSLQIISELKSDLPVQSPETRRLNDQLSQLLLISSPSTAIQRAIEDLKGEILQAQVRDNIQADTFQQEKTELANIFADPVFWDTYLKLKLTPLELRSVYRRFTDRVIIQDGRVQAVNLLV